MYTGIKHLHSFFAYILLAVLVIALVYILVSFIQNKPFTERMRKIALAGLISAHLQLLIGLLLYFISPIGFGNLSGEAMQDSLARLYVVEHPLTMLIAIVLITIGYSRAKKAADDRNSCKQILIFYTLGLGLILLRIPWMAWP